MNSTQSEKEQLEELILHMRNGAKRGRQTFEKMLLQVFDDGGNVLEISSCALGSIFLDIKFPDRGLRDHEWDYFKDGHPEHPVTFLEREFPILKSFKINILGVAKQPYQTLRQQIEILNDSRKLDRNAIANRLQSVANSLQSKA